MKNNKGVTLVALVVTIIVLVILATISIGMVLGNQGIFSKAEEAKKITANSQVAEEEGFNRIYEQIEDYISKGKPGKVEVGEIANKDRTIDGKEGSYNNPIIPKGFKPIDEGNAIWTKKDGYTEGLVIEDATSDETTRGSQFVWVPVPNYDEFHLKEGYDSGEIQYMLTDESGRGRYSKEAGASKTENLPGKPNPYNSTLGTDESVAMYQSVKNHGGFYIARFEAGIMNATKENKETQDGSIKPVSKAKVEVWNYIWQSSNDDKEGAIFIARGMYNNNKETTVTSTLCYGVQWDATISFIDPNYVDFAKDSSGMGNYTGILEVTGNKEEYKQKNIYDMAGNFLEATMETSRRRMFL